jgi:hypothetical protein
MGQRTGWINALWLIALAAAMAVTAAPSPVLAQDVFFTQSGGRGLQNAKMSARVSKVEADTKDLQAEMATIQPFAKKPIITCTNTADKLRWTGNDWLCDSETDPTVQSFAKKALPACGGGQILSASGSEFNCVNSGFLSAEADPTVQGFAKSPLPSCGTGEVLRASGGSLSCGTDERGLTQETDPYVHSFARTDAATISNCPASQVLTMNGNRLTCVQDAVGITVETDPKVQPFAKNDIAGYTLGACAAGEILTAVTQSGVVVLKCESGSTVVGGVIASTELDDLSDVAISAPSSDQVLRYNGTNWVNSSDKIGNMINTRWCHVSGADIVCDRDVPAPQPAAACAAGQMITWNSGTSTWGCTSLVGTISETLALDNLSDVTISAAAAGEGLTYTGSGWVNGYNRRIANFDSDVRVVDSSGGNGTVQVVVDNTALLTAIGGNVGIGFNNPNAALDVNGLISGTNLRVAGYLLGQTLHTSSYVSAGSVHTSGTVMVSNSLYADNIRSQGDVYVGGSLYVSGTQSIEGVVFANGGVSASGAISATSFYGDGSNLTGIAGGDRITSGTTFVQATEDESITFVTAGGQRAIIGTNGRVGVGTADPETELEVVGTVSATNLHLTGNLTVSGTQTIDGVVFANGGVSATGIVSATGFYGDGSGLTGVAANWYGLTNIPAQVIAVSDGTAIGMVGISATNVSVTTNLTAAQIAAGTGLFTTVTANSGSFGNVNATGYVSAASLYTSGSTLVSNTLRADVLRSVGNSYVGADLYVAGALYVSGSQSIDGVVFANGGVSASGAISATNFYGDGSGLTNVTADSMNWYGLTNIPTQVVAVSDGTSIQMVGVSASDISVTGNITTSGLAGTTGTFGTVAANTGSFGNVNTTGYVSATSFHTSGTANISNTLRADAARIGGDLYVSGNFYVSGSQSIEGVVFANGGVSATGAVTATTFYGDGSNLTGVVADWYGLTNVPTQVVAVSDGTSIQMVGVSSTDVSVTNNLTAAQVVASMGLFTTASATAVNGQYISGTEGYFPVATISALSAGAVGANTVSSTLVSASNVSATLVDATRNGTVSGTYGYFTNISGTNIYGTFTGDGSGLTGVTAGATDRIVSGTTAVYANTNTGYVSFTSGGTTTGWYSPGGIFAAVGVSTTGAISASGTGYFGGNVGIGMVAGIHKMSVSGSTLFNGPVWMGSSQPIVFGSSAAAIAGTSSYIAMTSGNAETMRLSADRRVGIGVTAPSQTLHVSGSVLTTSWTYINAAHNVRVTPTAPLEVSGTVSATAFVGDGSGLTNINVAALTGASDRIISGTSRILVSEDQSVTIRTGGSDRVIIGAAGDIGVGIGAGTPSATLHVSGTVKVAGTGAESCGATGYGSIRLNPSTGALQVCRQ